MDTCMAKYIISEGLYHHGFHCISLFFVLLLRQMQFWVYDFNVRNSISAQIGYMQITDQAYVDELFLIIPFPKTSSN